MSHEIPRPLIAALRSARRLRVVTGAGISVASGIPTYRGQGGIYDDPEEGDRDVQAMSLEGLQSDPDETWRQLAKKAQIVHQCSPNAAHLALAELEQVRPDTHLLTQNVDGLHHAAGSANIVEVHGNLRNVECLECESTKALGLDEIALFTETPRCTDCGGPLRPGVVLFGELLPEECVAKWRRHFVEQPAEVVLIIGTTGVFPYIRAPMQIALEHGGIVVEINPERTRLTKFTRFHLKGCATTYLPAIVEKLQISSG